ncbi:DMSO/selenate family reductase complex A subunit [Desulfovibrio sp. Fe33]|uniref:DMSO/selenate family reductase complex A subunit n=1 Tax=Desulfovibrio sp. Fe33 TaxID=3020842 RepID=UPI00234CA02E|nr:DMSO/selenate family reductase complex A subunit [Desulfovibrio sp. Fe33]
MTQKKKSTVAFSPERRSILKLGALSCAAGAAGGSLLGLNHLFQPSEAAAFDIPTLPDDPFIYTTCVNNCGSTCVLKAFVRNDKVIRVETDDSVQDDWENGVFQVRACPRGRSMRRHMYSPDRLKTPLKRIGKRGEGKFEPVSWDEALDIVAASLKHCIKDYGNASIYSHYASGVITGPMTRRENFWRLMNCLGGFSLGYSDYSSAQNQAALRYLYGKAGYSGNAISDIVHTKLAVFFGANLSETRSSGGGLQYEILEAKKKGNTKIIIIDPRYTDTCVTVADEWIPIRPGTDAALASALAYVLITEGMIDREYLNTHCVGFDASTLPEDAPEHSSYSDYILGTGFDMVAKTPEWAAAISGVPAARIYKLAREIGQIKPCYIMQGWGIQRQAAGEMNVMAVAALANLTGNVGIRGGNNGDLDAYHQSKTPRLPIGDNGVKTRFPVFMWLKAVEHGKDMTADQDGIIGGDRYPADIKFIWNYAGNTIINQHSEIAETERVLSDETKCEMIVVMDTHMTATAKWADIVLPSCMYPEQTDIVGPSYAMNTDWALLTEAVKPFFESRPVYDVCADLARRLGVEKEFTEGRDREAWIDYLYQTGTRKTFPEMPATVAEARKAGVHQRAKGRDFPVPFADFRQDPVAHPLKTPSGKVELYSAALRTLSQKRKVDSSVLGDVIPFVPQYVATWDGCEDMKTKEKYPLQLIGFHYKGRTHSHYANVDWLLEVLPQTMWINPIDAERRGIRHNDLVRVFNDRGEVRIRAKVTPRIIPGVVAMGQGAWYKPLSADSKVDVGGCINTLTKYRPTAIGKANPQHTNLVQVDRI